MNSIVLRALQTETGRRIELQLLMNLVSSSLHLPKRNLLMMSGGRALDIFAALTAEHLEGCDDLQRLRLADNAYRLGRKLRLMLTDRSDEALTRMTFQLYRNIGIDMDGSLPGTVQVSTCHFCRFYTPHICSVASLMDAGVVSGLFGGGRLEFTQRISEGYSHCICRLDTGSENK